MVYLIYGSPCSGKSTYINEHIEENDIVCDVDLIYSAISAHDAHDADLNVHEVALKLKNYLLDIIKNREGEWGNAYIISIANTDEKLKKDVNRVKADRCIYIDTPYEICMDRAKERPFYFQWIIEEWFATKDLKGDNDVERISR